MISSYIPDFNQVSYFLVSKYYHRESTEVMLDQCLLTNFPVVRMESHYTLKQLVCILW